VTEEIERIARLETTVAVHSISLSRIDQRLDSMMREAKDDRHALANKVHKDIGELEEKIDRLAGRLLGIGVAIVLTSAVVNGVLKAFGL
jgi:hypothetical protein